MAIANKDEERKLLSMLKKVTRKLSKISGIIEIGVGYRFEKGLLQETLSFVVYVGKKFSQADLANQHLIPKKMFDVPVDVIEITPSYHDLSRVDPLLGGISISNTRFASWGTVGCFVRSNSSGTLHGLTNHHVLVDTKKPFAKKGKVGDHINQPGLKPDVPEFNIGLLSNSDKNYDCAVFEVSAARQLNAVTSLQSMLGTIGQPVEPANGMLVKKAGAASGLTYGKIISITHAGFFVGFNDDKLPPNNLLSMGGDSGSVWVTDDAQNNIVGLHCFGDPNSAFANNIGPIFASLGIHL